MIRIVKLSFAEEHVDKFRNLFEERKTQIRHFPGCTHLELWEDKTEKGVFYTYSLWTEEGNLQSYRISDLFQDTWSQVKQWFNKPPQAFSADKLMSL